MFEIFQGQLLPDLADVIKVGGYPFDLTSATGVTFSMRHPWDSVPTVDHATATVTDAANGGVEYTWIGSDTADPGEYVYWWTVDFSGRAQDTPEGSLRILAHSPSSDLITVDDVILTSQIPAAIQPDPSPLIDFYIALASNRIMSEYGHFRPFEQNVTKRFPVRRYRARFFPYFLASATEVVLNPESYNRILDPTVPDYYLNPAVTLEGCYTDLQTSPWIPHVSPTQMRFGKPWLDVTGDWGYEEVPDAVRMGALVTVRSWMLRDSLVYSNMPATLDPSVAPRPTGTYGIPHAACEHLSLFKPTAGVT